MNSYCQPSVGANEGSVDPPYDIGKIFDQIYQLIATNGDKSNIENLADLEGFVQAHRAHQE